MGQGFQKMNKPERRSKNARICIICLADLPRHHIATPSSSPIIATSDELKVDVSLASLLRGGQGWHHEGQRMGWEGVLAL